MKTYTTAIILLAGIAGTQAVRAEGFAPWNEARAQQPEQIGEAAVTPRFAGFAPWLQTSGNRPLPQREEEARPAVAVSSTGFMPWEDRKA